MGVMAVSRRPGTEAYLMVRDANRQALACVYFEEVPGRRAPTGTFIRSSYLHEQRGR
jgi:hypothetical protein